VWFCCSAQLSAAGVSAELEHARAAHAEAAAAHEVRAHTHALTNAHLSADTRTRANHTHMRTDSHSHTHLQTQARAHSNARQVCERQLADARAQAAVSAARADEAEREVHRRSTEFDLV
jgi:hypothetical protein